MKLCLPEKEIEGRKLPRKHKFAMDQEEEKFVKFQRKHKFEREDAQKN